MVQKQLGLVFFCVLMLCLFGTHYSAINSFEDYPARVEVRPKDYGVSYGNSLLAEDLERLAMPGISYVKEETGRAGDVVVNVYITNGNYVLYKDFRILHGNFFTLRASEVGLNVALISDQLSVALFHTEEAVGNDIMLGEVLYRVCGVYTQDFLYKTLSTNGMETVIIPANSGFDRQYAAKASLRHVLMTAPEGSSQAFTADFIREELRKLSVNMDHYEVKDYTKTGTIVGQTLSLSSFFWAVMLSFILLRLLLRTLREVVCFVRERLQAMSFRRIYDENRLWLLSRLGVSLALVCAVVALIQLAIFVPYIPSRLLPSESIFDFSFYKGMITELLVQKNLLYAYKASPYELYYGVTILSCGVFCVMETCGAIWFSARVKQYNRL